MRLCVTSSEKATPAMSGATKGTESVAVALIVWAVRWFVALGSAERCREEIEAPLRKIASYGRAQRDKVALERPGLVPVVGCVHYLAGTPVAVPSMKTTAFARCARGF